MAPVAVIESPRLGDTLPLTELDDDTVAHGETEALPDTDADPHALCDGVGLPTGEGDSDADGDALFEGDPDGDDERDIAEVVD